ncbi:MAG TPA: prephenate dehydratase domain-containing protein [Kofleriaceae bacterium]|jgi:chorismate mutase/prephenate dehydratase
MSAPDLSSLRERIDAVDKQIIALLAERLRIVEGVVEAKLSTAAPFRDREREESLIARLREHAVAAGVDPHEVERLYRIIMELSVAHQEAMVRAREDVPLRVVYQGVEGSYSHLSAQRRYSGRTGGSLLQGHETFRAAADAVLHGRADLALLPIENTTAGSINEVYDLLANHALTITGEAVSAIEHCLLAIPGVRLDELRVVRSHPQALAQCSDFFAQHTHLTARADFDTAGSARNVAEAGDRTQAAIASSAAAGRYGLAILAQGIQSSAGNATRFVEIALRPAPVPDGVPAKTSLVISLADRPGALGEILMRFAAKGLSLTKIESRPLPEAPFTYRFYVDVLGHAASVPFQAALDEIRALTTELRVLGTYPLAAVI